MDNRLVKYSSELVSSLKECSTETSRWKIVSHSFLSTKDEATMEQQQLFDSGEKTINMKSIKSLLGVENSADNPEVVIVSIGTSSTQIYTDQKVIGNIFVGTSMMELNPDLAKGMFSEIFNVTLSLGIRAHIIVINSISH